MITERELEAAIDECERDAHDYTTCQRLATFYEIQDHLFGDTARAEPAEEKEVVGVYGDS